MKQALMCYRTKIQFPRRGEFDFIVSELYQDSKPAGL